jgi:hypothetical protein
LQIWTPGGAPPGQGQEICWPLKHEEEGEPSGIPALPGPGLPEEEPQPGASDATARAAAMAREKAVWCGVGMFEDPPFEDQKR